MQNLSIDRPGGDARGAQLVPPNGKIADFDRTGKLRVTQRPVQRPHRRRVGCRESGGALRAPSRARHAQEGTRVHSANLPQPATNLHTFRRTGAEPDRNPGTQRAPALHHGDDPVRVVPGEPQCQERLANAGRRNVEKKCRQPVHRALWRCATRHAVTRQPVHRGKGDVVQTGQRGNQHLQRTGVTPEPECPARCIHLLHRLHHLLLHPLRRESREMGRRGAERSEGCRLDGEAVARGKPNGAKRAQAVFAHALLCITDGTNNPRGKIPLSAERIAQVARGRTKGNCVDGEVAPCQVVLEAGAELHHRMPSVRLHVASECRDLVRYAALVEHADGAELDAHRHRSSPAEYLDHLPRSGGGGQVPVQRLAAEKRVPNGAAHAPRFKAGVFETPGNVEHARRWLKTVHQGDVAEYGCDGGR